MSNPTKIYIAGVGMITPIGGFTAMTATSARAGINCYQASSIYNQRYRPMKMAFVPDEALPPLNEEIASMDGLTARQARMLRLAAPALEQALAAYPYKEPLPLFLAGPETLPHCPVSINGRFIDQLILQTGTTSIHKDNSRLFATGRAGGIEAIDLAFNYFEATGQNYVLVGGVDTGLDHFLLGFLDSEDRILAENISDGFAPGEAAAFLLLASERVRTTLPNPVSCVYPPGVSNEPGHRYSDEPYRGDGLADAFQQALANSDSTPVSTIYSSLNGEHFGTKEFGVATTRNSSALDINAVLEHPADSFGDIGAALGPVLIGLSHYGLSQHKLKGPCLCYTSSEGALRGAVCVSA